LEKREKTLVIPDELIEYIAEQSYLENNRSGGKEGGRIVSKLMSELIEANIEHEISEKGEEYESADSIELVFSRPIGSLPFQRSDKPKIRVYFSQHEALYPLESLTQATVELDNGLKKTPDSPVPLQRVVADCQTLLKASLKRWQEENPAQTA